MRTALLAGLQTIPWHNDGLFMGMHWIWWLIVLATFFSMAWALVRVSSDRAKTQRRLGDQEVAEEALRRRFALGELDEEEFARRLKILRETTLG